ncbi:MAG: HIT domain-containing protein [Crenarchaeota archaeon]|nr:HIT domain-containing protein [Thermoproteota archaeon]
MHGYELLWAPWRARYVKSFAKKKEDKTCIFCEAPKRSDEEALILYRGEKAYIIMNLYPYNAGHVMVVPYKHVASLEDLDEDELLELMKLVNLAMKVIRRHMKPDGFNIGVNIGRAAGAGVDKHVHIHVVPRWVGDTNFMTVTAATRVISEDIRETYKGLRETLQEVMQERNTSS